MVNGTLGIFQKLWELVGTACCVLETQKEELIEDDQNTNLKNEMFRVRNSQLSMVK